METPLHTVTTIIHAVENMKELTKNLKQALWSTIGTKQDRVPSAIATKTHVACKELKKGTH